MRLTWKKQYTLLENTYTMANMLSEESRHRQVAKLRRRVEQLKLENGMTELQIRLLREEMAYLKNILLKHQKYHETQMSNRLKTSHSEYRDTLNSIIWTPVAGRDKRPLQSRGRAILVWNQEKDRLYPLLHSDFLSLLEPICAFIGSLLRVLPRISLTSARVD